MRTGRWRPGTVRVCPSRPTALGPSGSPPPQRLRAAGSEAVALRRDVGPGAAGRGWQLSSVSRSRYPVLRTRLYLMGFSICSLARSFTCSSSKYFLRAYYVPGRCWELGGDRNRFSCLGGAGVPREGGRGTCRMETGTVSMTHGRLPSPSPHVTCSSFTASLRSGPD